MNHSAAAGRCSLALVAALAIAGAMPASNQAHADEIDRLLLGAGATEVLHDRPLAGDFRAEYRSGLSLLPLVRLDVPYFTINPWVGLEVSTRGAVWGGGGIQLDIPLTHNLYFSPTEGIGLYERGAGKRLGSFIEFRSQAELAYQFDDLSRLSLDFSHISNAGLTKRNPGTEALTISYLVPLGLLILK